MKKYKHKNTGIIGTTNEHDNHLHFERCSGNVCSQETLSMYFVENSKDWKEVQELNYPIGTKFNAGDGEEYTISETKGNKVDIWWDDKQKSNFLYKIKQVNKFFKTGEWKEIVEKPVLFTTQDGVSIFEGDEIWFINKCLEFKPQKSKNYLADSRVFYFSTEDAAERYLFKNKPCLSLNDVYNAHRIIGYCNLDQQEKICDMIDKLKETVKNSI